MEKNLNDAWDVNQEVAGYFVSSCSPELSKRVDKDMDYIGDSQATKRRAVVNSMNDRTAEANGDQPCRVQ